MAPDDPVGEGAAAGRPWAEAPSTAVAELEELLRGAVATPPRRYVRGGEAREAVAERWCGQRGRPASLTLHPSSSSLRFGYCGGVSPIRSSTRG